MLWSIDEYDWQSISNIIKENLRSGTDLGKQMVHIN